MVIASALKINPYEVVGRLVELWIWADQNTKDGRTFVQDLSCIDHITGKEGFGQAMKKAGWLRETEQGFEFPNFLRHNGKSAKTRADSARSKKRQRTNVPSSIGQMSEDEQDIVSAPSSSTSTSTSTSSSEEGGVGETSSPEDFTGPRPVIPLTDPLTDFEPEVSAQAREFWSLFCIQHHGSIRNCHTEASHREMRHFAKAINAMGDKAVRALRNYYAKPPKEDKALAAYQIIIKLGLQPEVKQPKTTSNFEMLAKAIAGGMKV